jgi:hypothetical protein
MRERRNGGAAPWRNFNEDGPGSERGITGPIRGRLLAFIELEQLYPRRVGAAPSATTIAVGNRV